MKGFADLAGLPEDDQISTIRLAIAEGLTVGLFVDNNEKADYYLRKLGPLVTVIVRRKDLVKGSVFLKLGPRVH